MRYIQTLASTRCFFQAVEVAAAAVAVVATSREAMAAVAAMTREAMDRCFPLQGLCKKWHCKKIVLVHARNDNES